MFRVLDARAAVAELADLGRPHVAVPCIRGRHWHVRPAEERQDEEVDDAGQAAS